jgi:hypothetical protein
MKVTELRRELKARNLPTTGVKAVLEKRLQDAMAEQVLDDDTAVGSEEIEKMLGGGQEGSRKRSTTPITPLVSPSVDIHSHHSVDTKRQRSVVVTPVAAAFGRVWEGVRSPPVEGYKGGVSQIPNPSERVEMRRSAAPSPHREEGSDSRSHSLSLSHNPPSSITAPLVTSLPHQTRTPQKATQAFASASTSEPASSMVISMAQQQEQDQQQQQQQAAMGSTGRVTVVVQESTPSASLTGPSAVRGERLDQPGPLTGDATATMTASTGYGHSHTAASSPWMIEGRVISAAAFPALQHGSAHGYEGWQELLRSYGPLEQLECWYEGLQACCRAAFLHAAHAEQAMQQLNERWQGHLSVQMSPTTTTVAGGPPITASLSRGVPHPAIASTFCLTQTVPPLFYAEAGRG